MSHHTQDCKEKLLYFNMILSCATQIKTLADGTDVTLLQR